MEHGALASVGSAAGKVRILYVVNSVRFFISHRLPVANAAVAAGFDVHVAGDIEEQREVETLVRARIAFHRVPLHRSAGSPLRDLLSLVKLMALYQELRPEILHHVTSKPIILGSIAAKIVGTAAVVNAVSGLGYVFASRDLLARAVRSPMRLAYRVAMSGRRTFVIFQNSEDRNMLIGAGVNNDNVVIIRGSGVDLREFSVVPEPSEGLRIVLPARMLRDKGVVEFCQAAQIVRRKLPEAQFILAGRCDPGNPSGMSEGEINELCRVSGALWIGEHAKVSHLMSGAHVVCLPSYREGLPKSLIEACAAGRPIVTTDVPGCRDVVVDGYNGFLVPIRDPERLAEAIAVLLADSRLRGAFGKNARLRAEQHFDVKLIVANTLDLYKRALAHC